LRSAASAIFQGLPPNVDSRPAADGDHRVREDIVRNGPLDAVPVDDAVSALTRAANGAVGSRMGSVSRRLKATARTWKACMRITCETGPRGKSGVTAGRS
jgi:hypothetical protein